MGEKTTQTWPGPAKTPSPMLPSRWLQLGEGTPGPVSYGFHVDPLWFRVRCFWQLPSAVSRELCNQSHSQLPCSMLPKDQRP